MLGATRAALYLLDTKPLPIIGYTRDKSRSDFAATAAYGVCASRHLKYFSYKLVLLCTPAGVPAAYELVPASTDERVAGEGTVSLSLKTVQANMNSSFCTVLVVGRLQGKGSRICPYKPLSTKVKQCPGEQVLDWVWQARILADKGFLGADWQQGYRETRGLEILTPLRANQRPAQPAGFERWLNRVRERIEGAFHEVQNTGRHLEHLTCRTLQGLAHPCRGQDDEPCPQTSAPPSGRD